MKKWLFFLRRFNEQFFWEIYSAAGNLVCRSTRGFLSEDEARRDLADFHPSEHF